MAVVFSCAFTVLDNFYDDDAMIVFFIKSENKYTTQAFFSVLSCFIFIYFFSQENKHVDTFNKKPRKMYIATSTVFIAQNQVHVCTWAIRVPKISQFTPNREN